MKSRLRVIPAAVALATVFAAPAHAQDAASDDAVPRLNVPPPTTSESPDAVGPAQLRNFSLSGTVTRRAETPAQPQPAPSQSVAAAGPSEPRANPAAQPSRAVASNAVERNTAQARTAQGSTGGLNFGSLSGNSGPSTFTPAPVTTPPVATPDAEPFVPTSTEVQGGALALWPWLLALLSAAGAAVWYFRRPRERYAFAGGGADASAFELAQPPSPPARPAPRPAPAPPQAPRSPIPEAPVMGGIVSTRLRAMPDVDVRPEPAPPPPSVGLVSSRLRPWLDIEVTPTNAVIDGDKATVHFDVTVFNSGSAPARDVLIEASLFNAGADQDEAMAAFFANPVAQGERVPLIPPLQRMSFCSSTTVARDQMRIFEAGGRNLFVPVIGFNALYRWSGGEGQTSASYIVGRNSSGEKMAPLVVAEGARNYNGLGAHEHTVRVRK